MVTFIGYHISSNCQFEAGCDVLSSIAILMRQLFIDKPFNNETLRLFSRPGLRNQGLRHGTRPIV